MTTQHCAILRALNEGRILTGLDAIHDPEIRSMKLSTRIGEIEREGIKVERGWVTTATGKKVRSYWKKRKEELF